MKLKFYIPVFSVNVFAIILPFIMQMKLDGLGGFGNAMFMLVMIIGGAMVIPAGQALFARLFGQADDMPHGGFLRSAFYGGRIIGGMTIGLAAKGIKGIAHIVSHKKKGKDGDSGDGGSSDSDDGDKYSESDSGASDSGAEETSEGGSEE